MVTKRKAGLEEVVERIQATLGLSTKKEAEALVRDFESCLEDTLIEHLAEDGYSIKLGGFGRFIVHHRPPILRRLSFSGVICEPPMRRKVKFTGLRKSRQLERVKH